MSDPRVPATAVCELHDLSTTAETAAHAGKRCARALWYMRPVLVLLSLPGALTDALLDTRRAYQDEQHTDAADETVIEDILQCAVATCIHRHAWRGLFFSHAPVSIDMPCCGREMPEVL